MRLNNISIENFRNYEKIDLSFDKAKNVHLFIGDNAQGKTNFIEAITMLSLAKSFRAQKYTSLINESSEYARITGSAEKEKNSVNLEFFVSKVPQNKKNLRKNGVDVTVKDFIGELNIVLFHPEDLNMLYLSPNLRRKYIDTILSQTDPFYFDSLVHYNRALKQRNKGLQLISDNKASRDQLFVWDEKLAEYGSFILKQRLNLVEYFNNSLSGHYSLIADGDDKVKIDYQNTMSEKCVQKEEYLNEISHNHTNDILYRHTRKGVHRDDLLFYLNDKNVHEYASRGEVRTLLIALKLAEIDYIKEKTGQKPLLLLDDVFSELDKKRQQYLTSAIKGYQSFITTTHHDFPLEDASVFDIEMGILNSCHLRS
jgi:DNA replication and repair protein RecF